MYTGTRPGGSPATRAGKGWRGRRELAPRCSATQLGASQARPWPDTARSSSSEPHPTTTTTREAFDSNTRFLVCVTVMFQNPADGSCADRVLGSSAARRRKERRVRSMLRHERMTVAMALAEFLHRSSRGQRMARAGVWGHEQNYTAKVRKPSTPQPELFSLEEEPGGGLPAPLSEVAGRQDKVVRHVVEISAPSARSCRSSIFLCRRRWTT